MSKRQATISADQPTLWSRLTRLGKPLNRFWEQDEHFHIQEIWARTYKPRRGRHFLTALEYAKSYHKIIADKFDALDKKADWLVRYASGIATIVALLTSIAAIYGPATHRLAAGLSLPAVIMLIASVGVALRASCPTAEPVPMLPAEVVGITEKPNIDDEGQIQALVAASFHCAAFGLRLAVDEKASRVALASSCLVIGLGLLLLPIVAVVLGA